MEYVIKFYPANGDARHDAGGIFLPYFYLHGEIEERIGFDLVYIQPSSFPDILYRQIRYCQVFSDDGILDAVLFASWNGGSDRMTGLICDIRNREDLIDAIEKMYMFDRTATFHQEFIEAGHGESLEFINRYCLDRFYQGAKREQINSL